MGNIMGNIMGKEIYWDYNGIRSIYWDYLMENVRSPQKKAKRD
jgi:hypothetical protein